VSFLPPRSAYPLALSLTLLLPLLGSLLVVISHATTHVRRVARRRPSGPVAAFINPLDTALIVLALTAVGALNVGSWIAGRWQGFVGDAGILINVRWVPAFPAALQSNLMLTASCNHQPRL
jgi:hypothetical protein